MWRVRLGTAWVRMCKGACLFSVLLVLEGCDPTVRDAWLSGIQGLAVTSIQTLGSLGTTLFTTLIPILFTYLSQQGGGGTITTVQAAFELVEHLVC
jgi:hypothetical protein